MIVKESNSVPSKRRPHWAMRWRKWLKPFMSKHGAPEDIAGGIAVGFVVAFTPTIGAQIILSYLIATLLKVSRAAALVPIWITTPVTMTPIYAFTYQVGAWFVGGPSVNHVRRQLTNLVRRMDGYDTFDLRSRFGEALSIGGDIFIPMILGGLLVGGVCAAISYPITLWLIRRFRAHRERRRTLRKHRFHFPRLRHDDRL
jgi:uncharacterized protein